jgi:uracil-DNA glycosylase family 4
MAGQPKYSKPSTCDGCVLQHAGWGFAYPSGPVGARLTFIGEALGAEEAIHGEPFVGAAGGVLSRLCVRAGIDRQHARIANVVSCRPPENLLVGTGYEHAAIDRCRQYLQPILDSVPRDGVVVPLGATALRSVLDLHGAHGIDVKDFHGTVSRSRDDRYWIVPSFHPSHLQRGAMNLLDVVTSDLALAQRVAQRGFVRTPFELVVDPPLEYIRTWIDETLRQILHDPDAVHVALDTEYAEKASGQDESEVVLGDVISPMTRINLARDGHTGITFPYRQPFISELERLLIGLQNGGWLWLWNKYADWEHLKHARHTTSGILALDAMWLWKYLQSDLPRGLGFVAAMASDFGPWKHWARTEGRYAAADGVQTWRTAMWLLDGAQKTGLWDVFLRDWHERDTYVLRPAKDMGVPVDRPALEAFHADLQVKLGTILQRIKQIEIEGVYKPKEGYARKPKGVACSACEGSGYATMPADDPMPDLPDLCGVCKGDGAIYTPPATILGKPPKKGGSEAKTAYMAEGIELVQREIETEILVCRTCGELPLSKKHRCVQPKTPKREKGQPKPEKPAALIPNVVTERRTVSRYFWRVPFNPDAGAQVIAYIEGRGYAAPIDKKTKKKTTNKAAMQALLEQYQDDPFFLLKLDWAAVQKVDATYAVGSLALMDGNDRLHPEVLPKPSTLRDSCVSPNLQNVVADKSGADGLAAGFRRCIVAVDGPPPGTTDDMLATWIERYGL